MFPRRLAVLLLSFALVLTGTASAQPKAVWRNVEMVGGGYVTGLLYHPKARDLAYARTDIGGAYRWDPETRRWTALTDHLGWDDWNLLGVESIGLDPNDPDALYLAVGTYVQPWAGNGAILRSHDRGRTWQRTDLPIKLGANEAGRVAGERLLVDPRDSRVLYFGSRLDGLWRSTDTGATWSKVDSFPVASSPGTAGISFVVAGPDGALYAGYTGDGPKLFRSTDSGTTWTAVPGQPGLLPQQAKFDGAGALYLAYADAMGPNGMTNGAVWKLDGDRWTDITPLRPNSGAEQGFGYSGLDVSGGAVVVTTNDRWGPGDDIFRSIDSGATWKSVKAASERDASASPWLTNGGAEAELGHWLGAIAINPARPGEMMYGTGTTVWGSTDVTNLDQGGTSHWRVRASGLEETAVLDLVSPPSGAHLLSGVRDIGGFRHDSLRCSPDAGAFQNPLFANTTDLDFAQGRPEIVVRVGTVWSGQQHGAWSSDGGETWTPFATEPPTSVDGGGTTAVSANATTFVWTPDKGSAARTADKGATWSAAQGLPANAVVVADRRSDQVFYALSGGDLYRSGDGAATFTSVASGLPDGHLYASPDASGDLWIAAGEGGLWHSTDGGTTFTRKTAAQTADNLGFGKAAPGKATSTLFSSARVNGVRGIYRSTDDGASWVRVNDDQHQWGWTGAAITGDPRVYGRVYVGTNGRGIQYADTGDR